MAVATVASRIFDGDYAQGELEEALDEAGVKRSRIGWDSYDQSIELYGVAADYRLSIEAQKAIHGAGFTQAYVNHVDEWETHYRFKPDEPFAESKGWRVSYPHKRSGTETGIWVEQIVDGWPKDWFESGKCVVKTAVT